MQENDSLAWSKKNLSEKSQTIRIAIERSSLSGSEKARLLELASDLRIAAHCHGAISEIRKALHD